MTFRRMDNMAHLARKSGCSDAEVVSFEKGFLAAGEMFANAKEREKEEQIERARAIFKRRRFGFAGRRFIAYFWFMGWEHVNFGIHLNLAAPNIEIHVPFGFVRIGLDPSWKHREELGL